MKQICIQVAMKQEARFLLDALPLQEMEPLDSEMGMRLYRGTHGRFQISLALQGTDPRHGVEQVGLEPATLCTYLLLQKIRPSLLLNFGTAGAFESRGAKIGEVYLVRPPVFYHDRRVPLPGYDEAGIGKHDAYAPAELARELGFKFGTLSSGSSLEASARDLEVLRQQGADLVDMEGAAIAWVCERKGVRCMQVKSVTDLIDRPAPVGEQFVANLRQASESLRDAVMRIMAWLERNEFEDR